MQKYTIRHRTITTGERVYMGLDVHKDSIHVTVLGEDRNASPLLQRTVPNARRHVDALVRQFPDCEIEAVYEAGPTGYSLMRWFQDNGCKVFMTPPCKILQEKGGKQIKTDSRDSLACAEQLRNRQLTKVHDLGDRGYRRRELTRTREQLRNHRSAICSQIKSKLLLHGVAIPEDMSTRWTRAFVQWLQQEPSGDPHLDFCIGMLVQTYQQLSRQMKELEDKLEELAAVEDFEEDVELLTSVPGISTLTAMTLLLELGDISRFDRSDEFSSFLGLIPGEWSSGQTQRKRGLLRWGNRRARTALVQASWYLIGKDARMRAVYERIKFKKNSGTAICAVARRLALAVRAMLRDRAPYECCEFEPGG